jgi:general secretion pathway protein J
MRKLKTANGFTLLEVLVASAIGAFIAVISVSFLRSAIAGREFIEENIAVADEVRYATNLLKTDFANLYRDVNKSKIVFEGLVDETETGFAANLKMHVISCSKARADAFEGDIYEVQYSLMQNQDKSVLMRRLCPVVGIEEPEETQGGILTVIAENIAGFDVMYFDGSEWTEEWIDKKGAPVFVEVTLTALPAKMFDPDRDFDYEMPDQDDMSSQDLVKNSVVKSFMVCFTRDGREVAGVDPYSDDDQPEGTD